MALSILEDGALPRRQRNSRSIGARNPTGSVHHQEELAKAGGMLADASARPKVYAVNVHISAPIGEMDARGRVARE
jgi:hypothetical protein